MLVSQQVTRSAHLTDNKKWFPRAFSFGSAKIKQIERIVIYSNWGTIFILAPSLHKNDYEYLAKLALSDLDTVSTDLCEQSSLASVLSGAGEEGNGFPQSLSPQKGVEENKPPLFCSRSQICHQ